MAISQNIGQDLQKIVMYKETAFEAYDAICKYFEGSSALVEEYAVTEFYELAVGVTGGISKFPHVTDFIVAFKTAFKKCDDIRSSVPVSHARILFLRSVSEKFPNFVDRQQSKIRNSSLQFPPPSLEEIYADLEDVSRHQTLASTTSGTAMYSGNNNSRSNNSNNKGGASGDKEKGRKLRKDEKGNVIVCVWDGGNHPSDKCWLKHPHLKVEWETKAKRPYPGAWPPPYNEEFQKREHARLNKEAAKGTSMGNFAAMGNLVPDHPFQDDTPYSSWSMLALANCSPKLEVSIDSPAETSFSEINLKLYDFSSDSPFLPFNERIKDTEDL